MGRDNGKNPGKKHSITRGSEYRCMRLGSGKLHFDYIKRLIEMTGPGGCFSEGIGWPFLMRF